MVSVIMNNIPEIIVNVEEDEACIKKIINIPTPINNMKKNGKGVSLKK
jgi:hypothetical protein